MLLGIFLIIPYECRWCISLILELITRLTVFIPSKVWLKTSLCGSLERIHSPRVSSSSQWGHGAELLLGWDCGEQHSSACSRALPGAKHIPNTTPGVPLTVNETCFLSRHCVCVQEKQHGDLSDLHEGPHEGEAESRFLLCPRAGEGTAPFSSDDPLRDVVQSLGCDEQAAATRTPWQSISEASGWWHGQVCPYSTPGHGMSRMPEVPWVQQGACAMQALESVAPATRASFREPCLGWCSAEDKNKLQAVALVARGAAGWDHSHLSLCFQPAHSMIWQDRPGAFIPLIITVLQLQFFAFFFIFFTLST